MTYPILIDTKDGHTRIFYEDWTWMSVTIPKGFNTDGTSSPWLFRSFVPRFGKYVFAAYVHDYALTIMSRKEARMKYYNCCKELKMPKINLALRYFGIRMFDLIKYKV